MKLSVAIATHNETENITRTLESVYDWVDEIVIVDGQSTDGTVKVIEEFDKASKIKVFHESNPPMFHINKQKALEKCTGDWILQLDADEVVSAPLKEEILSVIASETKQSHEIAASSRSVNMNVTPRDDKIVAYWIPRLNYFLGRPLRKGGQYPDMTLRLYRRDYGYLPALDTHEQAVISATPLKKDELGHYLPPEKLITTGTTVESGNHFLTMRKNMASKTSLKYNWPANQQKIGCLHNDLWHYPYGTFAIYIDKWKRYSKLEAELLREKGVKPSVTTFVKYVVVEPTVWFLKTYFRHKGFMDGWAGFVFSFMSALRFWEIYKNL